MNIYLLSQSDNVDYDTFDSMVVIAANEDDARHMRPSGSWEDNIWNSWADKPENVDVEFIGTTEADEPRVVCASFNAG